MYGVLRKELNLETTIQIHSSQVYFVKVHLYHEEGVRV